jgi:hypothetical protein
LLVVGILLAPACHRDPPPRMRLKNIHKCEDGSKRALQEKTREAAMQVFYENCADLFVELPCRNAVARAARLREADQLRGIVEECRKAYCPVGKNVEACRPDFVMTKERLPTAWHELSGAIIEYDAAAYLQQVQEVLYWFFSGLANVPETPPDAGAG